MKMVCVIEYPEIQPYKWPKQDNFSGYVNQKIELCRTRFEIKPYFG